jgi:hypothetical protein
MSTADTIGFLQNRRVEFCRTYTQRVLSRVEAPPQWAHAGPGGTADPGPGTGWHTTGTETPPGPLWWKDFSGRGEVKHNATSGRAARIDRQPVGTPLSGPARAVGGPDSERAGRVEGENPVREAVKGVLVMRLRAVLDLAPEPAPFRQAPGPTVSVAVPASASTRDR